jgi:Na+-transporting NADH:ubiquinone oxidoreductase subunit C
VHKNSYVFIFASVVTITCSILLASAASLLRDRQQENIALDKQKNILSSAGLIKSSEEEVTRQEILSLYDANISSQVVDTTGMVMENKKVENIDPKKDRHLLPVYLYQKDGSVKSYIIPISGKGLWSTIYGYLALEPDLNTVRGITFYQHGETPGLGGEIVKDWFTSNFVGKRIISPEGKLVSITVIKGKVAGRIPDSESYHYVDGISGSTLTGNGLTNFLKKDLERYEPYFETLRNKEME